MVKFLFLFIFSLAITFILVPFLIKRALKFQVFDQPRAGKIHQEPTPRLGGVAIYLSFLATLLISFLIIPGLDLRIFFLILTSATIFFGAGILDDFFNIAPKLKLFLVTLAGVVVIFAFPLGGWPLWLKLISYLAMIVWVDYLSNAFNLLDGMDSLCSGVFLIAGFFFLILALLAGKPTAFLLSLILLGSVSGFLKYNLPKAEIFLGDSGSYFLGGMLAVIAIEILGVSSFKIIPILWILGIPVIDTSTVLLRRVLLKSDPLEGDLMHSYNLMLGRIKNYNLVLILVGAGGLIFGLIGILLFFAPSWLILVSLIIPLSVLFYQIKFSSYFKKNYEKK